MSKITTLGIVLALLIITIAFLHIVHASQLYELVQVRVQLDNASSTRTLLVHPDTVYTLKLCGVAPYKKVAVYLPDYSTYGIAQVRYVDSLGQVHNAVADIYELRELVLRVKPDMLCVYVDLAKYGQAVSGQVVGRIEVVREVVNENVTVDDKVVPLYAVINGTIARLSHVDVCVLSLAPVKVMLRTSRFAVFTRNDTVVLNKSLTLYRICTRSYELPLTLSVYGAATLRITAYYVKQSSQSWTPSLIRIRLSPVIIRECSNVKLCNATSCGMSVLVRPRVDQVFVTVSGLVTHRLVVDSVFTRDVELSIPDLVTPSMLDVVDKQGSRVNLTEIELVVKGPIATRLTPRTCLVEGRYRVVLRIYNKTFDVGYEDIVRGGVLQLPIRTYQVEVSPPEGLCREAKCSVRMKLDSVVVENPEVIVLPPGRSLVDLSFYIVYHGYEVPVWVKVVDNTIKVRLCLTKLRVQITDLLGFNLEEGNITLRHGMHTYSCRVGQECLVPCGDYELEAQVETEHISEHVSLAPNPAHCVTLRTSVLSMRSIELLLCILCVVLVALCAAAVRRFARTRREVESESEIIEIS